MCTVENKLKMYNIFNISEAHNVLLYSITKKLLLILELHAHFSCDMLMGIQ